MLPTRTINLPSGGTAVVKTSMTNRDRIRISGAGKSEDVITMGIRVLLMEYKEKVGKEAVDSFLESTDGSDFTVIVNAAAEVVNGVEDAPKE